MPSSRAPLGRKPMPMCRVAVPSSKAGACLESAENGRARMECRAAGPGRKGGGNPSVLPPAAGKGSDRPAAAPPSLGWLDLRSLAFPLPLPLLA
ncbi:hypothetical protein ACP70R_034312 [Stipagrostis hirtigluma subsp. patula]